MMRSNVDPESNKIKPNKAMFFIFMSARLKFTLIIQICL